MKRVVLIDADTVVWRAAACVQSNVNFGTAEEPEWMFEADPRDAEMAARRIIQSIKTRTESREVVLCLSPQPDGDREHNHYWRHDILPSYKQHRPEKEKKYQAPLLTFGHVRKFLTKHYQVVSEPNLEADDLLGILATEDQFAEERVVASNDKDMKQIPGLYYDLNHTDRGVQTITPEQADRYHMYQTLVGDVSDNYKGCKGVGPVNADRILDASAPNYWPGVVAAFISKGLTESDALVQARVSRILRWGEFDFKTCHVKLWEPPKC